jgi:hypothetical protein
VQRVQIDVEVADFAGSRVYEELRHVIRVYGARVSVECLGIENLAHKRRIREGERTEQR